MKKRNKIIYWIFTVWLALGMTSTGIVQIFKINAGTGVGGVDNVTHLGYPVYLLTLLGTWKLLGVIALLIPKFPVLKEWAYAGIFFTVTGALYSHIMPGNDSFKEIFPALLYLVLIALSYFFRPANRKMGAAIQ